MSVDIDRAVARSISICQAAGFNTTNPGWKGDVMIEAIVTALVEEITNQAQVVIPGGSSSGTYPII